LYQEPLEAWQAVKITIREQGGEDRPRLAT